MFRSELSFVMTPIFRMKALKVEKSIFTIKNRLRLLCFFRRFLLTFFSLLFLLSPLQNFAGESSLGGKAITRDEVLVFGGSFSPPTLEHMGIVTNLMVRFGFQQGTLLPTYPYKAGAAPAEVSLHLTQLAVETADEVLDINGVESIHFERVGTGSSHWENNKGESFHLAVDDFEIREKVKGDTLSTLMNLSTQHKDPKRVYWVSGSDSFSSVPSWTPRWKEMFAHANWVIISRKGTETDSSYIDFNKENPLKGIFEESFLSQYTYYFDKTNQTHVYRNKSEALPSLYIVDQPALNDSSSMNRKSLAEDKDRKHAQAGLQPSIFKECIEKGYYKAEVTTDQSSEHSEGTDQYQTLTLENLMHYTQWLLGRIERRQVTELSAQEIQDYRKFSEELLLILQEEVKSTPNRSLAVAAWLFLVEHLREQLENVGRIKNLSKMINQTAKKFNARGFAIAFVVLELAEVLVIPPLLYWIGGPKAIALAPFIHPNEMITIPSFFLWNLYRRAKERARLSGDSQTFKLMKDYRNRLLRGDPDLIVARMRLSASLGIDSAGLSLNIVKSRLPNWIPLKIRKWQDKKVKWYDLNLSTNELRALLNDVPLERKIAEAADGNAEVFSHLLVAALVSQPDSRAMLDLFSLHRYFRLIGFGEIPDEIISGFSLSEQNFARKAADSLGPVFRSLDFPQFNLLKESLAYTFALHRVLTLHPDQSENSKFWESAINLIVTGYPNQKANLLHLKEEELLRLHLVFYLMRFLNSNSSGQLSHFSISPLLRVSKSREYKTLPSPSRFVKPGRSETLEMARIGELAKDYILKNRTAFSRLPFGSGQNLEEAEWSPLPLTQRGDDLSGPNLIWEIELLRSSIRHHNKMLGASFERAKKYLQTRTDSKLIARRFQKSYDQIQGQIQKSLQDLMDVEYQWLPKKFPYQSGSMAENETQISQHGEFRDQVSELENELNDHLFHIRNLIALMNGTLASDLTREVEVDHKIQESLSATNPSRRKGASNSCAQRLGNSDDPGI